MVTEALAFSTLPPLSHFKDHPSQVLSNKAATWSLARPSLLASSRPAFHFWDWKALLWETEGREAAPEMWETATQFHKTHLFTDTTPSPNIGSEKLLSRCQKFFYHPVVLFLGIFKEAGLCPHPAPKHREAEECLENAVAAT